jgi:PAS domain S-box-containing protein
MTWDKSSKKLRQVRYYPHKPNWASDRHFPWNLIYACVIRASPKTSEVFGDFGSLPLLGGDILMLPSFCPVNDQAETAIASDPSGSGQLSSWERELAESRAALRRAQEDLQRHVEERTAALGASEAKYRCLVENLEQSVFLKDRDFRFAAANRPFCRDLGRAEKDIVGRTDFDFFPPDLAAKYRADDARVKTTGIPLEVEEENVAAGQKRLVRVVKTLVKDDQGQAVGVLGIFWDVTEQRALEANLRQAQKMEAVGQLAGGVAHDFNNLLTVILGNTAMVMSQLGPADGCRELLQAVEQAATRAAQLTRQMLGFSRRAPLRAEPTLLGQSIQDTVRLLRRTIDPRITVEAQLADHLWPVLADPTQMSQVLMNLCLNARDAMPEGGRLLLQADNVVLGTDHTRLFPDSRPGEFVRMRVEDTGCGIAPDVLPHIFEPFFTTKEVGQGTGLGLAMVFGIVKQHLGWIDCSSEVGKGARFEIFLPRHCRVPEPAPAPLAPRPAPGHETILLADDEPMIRHLGRRILERSGYEVVLAEDGQQAVEAYSRDRGRIDLVILDLSMPKLSGRDAFRRLRQIDPEVRVIFASGYSGEGAGDAQDRALGFVGKPYRPDDLTRAVRAALDQQAAGFIPGDPHGGDKPRRSL